MRSVGSDRICLAITADSSIDRKSVSHWQKEMLELGRAYVMELPAHWERQQLDFFL